MGRRPDCDALPKDAYLSYKQAVYTTNRQIAEEVALWMTRATIRLTGLSVRRLALVQSGDQLGR